MAPNTKQETMAVKTVDRDENIVSKRAQEYLVPELAMAVYERCRENRYHKDTNPTGRVNLCIAVNRAGSEMLREELEAHPEYCVPPTDHLLDYSPCGGYEGAKQAISNFFRYYHGAEMATSEMILLPCCYGAIDAIAHCLFESGDVLLSPRPTYSGMSTACFTRNAVKIEGVEGVRETIDIPKFEKSLMHYRSLGKNVRGLVLMNPHNPLGTFYPKDDLIALCNWAASHGLYVLLDEIFGETVHEGVEFNSYHKYKHELEHPEMVVYVWSISKGFGLPGVRLGLAHTLNKTLHEALCQVEGCYSVSSFAMNFVSNFLANEAFVHKYFAMLKRNLRLRSEFVSSNVEALGIPFVRAQAGLFIYIDLRKYLETNDFAGEDKLFNYLVEEGVVMTPGVHADSTEPGWFRLAFGGSKEEIVEGMRRFHRIFGKGSSLLGFLDV